MDFNYLKYVKIGIFEGFDHFVTHFTVLPWTLVYKHMRGIFRCMQSMGSGLFFTSITTKTRSKDSFSPILQTISTGFTRNLFLRSLELFLEGGHILGSFFIWIGPKLGQRSLFCLLYKKVSTGFTWLFKAHWNYFQKFEEYGPQGP